MSREWHDLTLLGKDHSGCHAENGRVGNRSAVRSWPQWSGQETVVVQTTGSNGGHEKCKECRYMLKAEKTGFAEALNGSDQRTEVKDDSKVYSLNAPWLE